MAGGRIAYVCEGASLVASGVCPQEHGAMACGRMACVCEGASLVASGACPLSQAGPVPRSTVHFLCYEVKGRDLFRLEEVDPATGATIVA